MHQDVLAMRESKRAEMAQFLTTFRVLHAHLRRCFLPTSERGASQPNRGFDSLHPLHL
jgi:hypothetical protein